MTILLYVLLTLFVLTFLGKCSNMWDDKYPVTTMTSFQRAVVECLLDLAMIGFLIYFIGQL
jgi:hypothetical protein